MTACLKKMIALSGQRWQKQDCRDLCDNCHTKWSHIVVCLYLETCYACVSVVSDKTRSLYQDRFLQEDVCVSLEKRNLRSKILFL